MLHSSCEGEEWETMWEKQLFRHQGYQKSRGRRCSRCWSKDSLAARGEDHAPPTEHEGPHRSRYPTCSPWNAPHQSRSSYLYVMQASKLGKDPSINLSTFSQSVEWLHPDTWHSCKDELHFSQLWGKMTRNLRKQLLEPVNNNGRGMWLMTEIKTVRSLNEMLTF